MRLTSSSRNSLLNCMVYSYSPDLESAGEVCGLKVASRCDVITVGHVGARGLRSHCLSETPNDKGTPKRAHSVRGHRGSPRHARSSRHEILRFALQLRTQCSLRIPPIHGSFLGQEQEPASHAQELPQAQSQALRGEVICKRSVSYARYLDSTLHAGRMVG